jgi:hypothetical protein
MLLREAMFPAPNAAVGRAHKTSRKRHGNHTEVEDMREDGIAGYEPQTVKVIDLKYVNVRCNDRNE